MGAADTPVKKRIFGPRAASPLASTTAGSPTVAVIAIRRQPLGPYFQWTAKVSGKTVNRRQSAREAELYEEWIGNDRRLRALIEELRQVAEEATNLILETEARVSF